MSLSSQVAPHACPRKPRVHRDAGRRPARKGEFSRQSERLPHVQARGRPEEMGFRECLPERGAEDRIVEETSQMRRVPSGRACAKAARGGPATIDRLVKCFTLALLATALAAAPALAGGVNIGKVFAGGTRLSAMDFQDNEWAYVP